MDEISVAECARCLKNPTAVAFGYWWVFSLTNLWTLVFSITPIRCMVLLWNCCSAPKSQTLLWVKKVFLVLLFSLTVHTFDFTFTAALLLPHCLNSKTSLLLSQTNISRSISFSVKSKKSQNSIFYFINSVLINAVQITAESFLYWLWSSKRKHMCNH